MHTHDYVYLTIIAAIIVISRIRRRKLVKEIKEQSQTIAFLKTQRKPLTLTKEEEEAGIRIHKGSHNGEEHEAKLLVFSEESMARHYEISEKLDMEERS